jgi:hypothetical protein
VFEMKKQIFPAIVIALVLLSVAFGLYGLRPWRVSVTDEFGEPVTISSFTINTADSTAATVYSDENKTAFTNPATSGTTVNWWSGVTSFDIVATDGSRTILQPAITKATKRIEIPSYVDLVTVATHVSDDVTLTPADSGKMYVSDGNDGGAANVVFTLPSAYAGLEYYIVDSNETAADDVWITCASGDTINDGTAGKSYKHATDAENFSIVHIAAIDGTSWIVITERGTWANDNS